MPVNPRGSSWEAALSFKGRRARASFATQAEAEAWHADAYAALVNGRPLPPTKRSSGASTGGIGTTMRTARDWAEMGCWSAIKSRHETLLKADAVVRYFGEERDIETISTSDILGFQRALSAAGDSPATVNRKVSALSGMMKEVAVKRDFKWAPPQFPPRLGEPEGRKGVLVAPQVEAVEALLRKAGDHETADLVALLFWTGLRLGEMERLRWADVAHPDVGRSFLRVLETKTGSSRDVPVVAQAHAILARRRHEWMEAKVQPMHPYLNRQGARVFPALRYAHALRAFQRACRLLEIEGDDLCLHTLRHSCATHLLRMGMSERQVMKWMGHKTLSMMVRYTRVFSSDLADAAAMLDSKTTSA